VLNPRFKLKCIRFCSGRLYDVENTKTFTKKVTNTLLRLYEYYMKVDEEVEIVHDAEIIRNKHDVNVDSIMIYDMSNDLTFQFKKHLKEEDDVEEKKIRLRGI
jgi:hypothetical protein